MDLTKKKTEGNSVYLKDLRDIVRMMESLAEWENNYVGNDVYPLSLTVQVRNANGYQIGWIEYHEEQWKFTEDYEEDDPA
jgi:hypothetical protein